MNPFPERWLITVAKGLTLPFVVFVAVYLLPGCDETTLEPVEQLTIVGPPPRSKHLVGDTISMSWNSPLERYAIMLVDTGGATEVLPLFDAGPTTARLAVPDRFGADSLRIMLHDSATAEEALVSIRHRYLLLTTQPATQGYAVGDTMHIGWKLTPPASSVVVLLNVESTGDVIYLTSQNSISPPQLSHSWVVGTGAELEILPAVSCRLQIVDYQAAEISDQADSTFNIHAAPQ